MTCSWLRAIWWTYLFSNGHQETYLKEPGVVLFLQFTVCLHTYAYFHETHSLMSFDICEHL